VQSGGKGGWVALGHERGRHPIWLPNRDVVLNPIRVGVEVLQGVSQAAERSAGRGSVHEIAAALARWLRTAEHNRIEEFPRFLRASADLGGILRVVDVAQLVAEECVASYGTSAGRRADENLEHGSVVDLSWRQRITGDALVVLDVERVAVRCPQPGQGSKDGRRCCDQQTRPEAAG
jgi:hypothetical protein